MYIRAMEHNVRNRPHSNISHLLIQNILDMMYEIIAICPCTGPLVFIRVIVFQSLIYTLIFVMIYV